MALIAVAPDTFARGVGSTTPSRKPPRAVYQQLDLDDALARTYDTDAHCVTYILPTDDGMQPRLTKTAPQDLLDAARIHYVFVDADNPGHAPWTDELVEDAISRYQKISIPHGVYHTSKGARFIVELAAPVPVLEAEPIIRRVLSILDGDGMRVDWIAKDWTRHFRMPNVVRSGRPFRSPHVDLSRLAPVTVEPLDIPARQPMRKKPRPIPEIPWTPSLADHWQERARTIGAAMDAPGERHDLCLALAGALLQRSVPPEHVPELVRLAVIAAGFSSPSHHEKSARDTVSRYIAGHALRGMRDLVIRWPLVADAVHDAFADARQLHLQSVTMAAPAAPPSPLEQTTAALERTIANAPDGLTVIVAECGLGKTYAAQRVAAARATSMNLDAKRAPPQTKTAISVDKNELAMQIAGDLEKQNVPVRRVFGPLSVLKPDGTPVCHFAPKALPLVEGGQSVTWEFCLGRGKYRCEYYDTCPAKDGYVDTGVDTDVLDDDPPRPRVTVGTHALLRELDGSAGTTGLLVIDEPPPLLETMTLTLDDVRLAIANVDSFSRDYAEAMRPVLLALRDWEDPNLTFDDLTDTLERPPTEDADGKPITRPPIRHDAIHAARADVVVAKTLGAASRTLRALHRAMTTEDAMVRLEEEPHRIVITAAREDLAAALRREGAVVAMDANADLHLPGFAKVVGYQPPTSRFVAEDGAPIRRTMLRCGTATRRSWLSHGRLVLDTGLLAALRGVAAWTEECAQVLGRPVQLGIITIRLVELVLRAAAGEDVIPQWVAAGRQSSRVYEDAKREIAAMFDGIPIVRPVALAHYGATRGLNRLAGVDCLATIGDPWPNIGIVQAEATYLGVEPDERAEATAQAELEQAHGRLRTVHRRAPGFALHVGRVVPGGSGWRSSSVEIRTLEGGRPKAGAPMPPAELSGIVATLGGVRSTARAVGCNEKSIRNYMAGRGVPPAVASTLRHLAKGVSSALGIVQPADETPLKKNDLNRGFVRPLATLPPASVAAIDVDGSTQVNPVTRLT